ncbi:hypothetical protein A2870_03895 [Candidatus Curtissbacteria bacterium RIFCSPHIGHO2_01_FULL_41_11]|uniref:Uncharacterized protein n=1 Tax=Candidatus Curtissbacteria bacterium RIFCSPHIGHO2_01_FULL_41_11 TaxID=1797711 RepID=A0A1F5G467_9BACT|nr:MAG: hypothetical protein A2870_03895 [Candidatus Curtissbacteria bacterium RIFCSPHIGHO2_01_FULL_41_11]
MPELPEVTVIANSLNKKIKGLTLESIEYDWPKKFFWNGFSVKDLKGAKVTKVDRRGKVVLIETDKNITILIHLKLTGQLIYQDKKMRIAGGHPLPPLNLPVPNKTTRVTFVFNNGGPTSSVRLRSGLRGTSHLYFNDIRKFGWVRIVESGKLKVESFLEKLGPDALEISFENFSQRLASKGKVRIKKLLMDQTFVAGIGNIYSDEGLWRAKIHPARAVGSLSDSEIKALYKGLQESLKLAIEKGGSSANSFVDSGGEAGLFLTFAKAYHMTGKPCARCGTPIARKKMDGRSAHFCPACQQQFPK